MLTNMDDEVFDLFERYELMPIALKEKIDSYNAEYGLSAQDCANLLKEVEQLGYTFEYGLSYEPYGLRKIGQPNTFD